MATLALTIPTARIPYETASTVHTRHGTRLSRTFGQRSQLRRRSSRWRALSRSPMPALRGTYSGEKEADDLRGGGEGGGDPRGLKETSEKTAKIKFYKLTGGRRPVDEGGNEFLKKQRDWAAVHPLLGPQYIGVISYSVVNLVLQGGVLIVALLALLHEDATIPHTTLSGTWLVVVEIIGLAFLLIVALLAGQVGRQRQRVEAVERDDEAQKLAEYIAKEIKDGHIAVTQTAREGSSTGGKAAAQRPDGSPAGG